MSRSSRSIKQVTQHSAGTEGGKLDSIGQWEEQQRIGSTFSGQKAIQIDWCLGDVLGSDKTDVGEGLDCHNRGWGDSNKVQMKVLESDSNSNPSSLTKDMCAKQALPFSKSQCSHL